MIPGQQARAYVEGIAPRTVRVSLWPLLYSALALLALALVVVTAAVPQTAHNPAELHHLGFGLPLNFVYGDVSVHIDWVLATLAVVAPVWVIRRLWLRGLSQLGLDR